MILAIALIAGALYGAGRFGLAVLPQVEEEAANAMESSVFTSEN